MKRIFRQGTAAALCLFLCLFCLSPAAYGYAPIPNKAACSLTLQKQHPGVTFSVYQAATVQTDAQGNVTFQPTSAFASYPVSWHHTTTESWQGAAGALAGYVESDHLTTPYTGKVRSDGTLRFDNLPQGLYLVFCRETYTDESGAVCKPMTSLICLPNWVGTANGTGRWEHNVSMICKVERSTDKTIRRDVLKVWKDNDNAANRRPNQVTIDLLKDGAVYDTVTLSEANNWTHSWTDLENGPNWQVVERNANGYQVSVSLRGVTFVVTNTYRTTPPPGGGSDPAPTPDPPSVIPPPLEEIDDPGVPLSPPPEFDPYEPPDDGSDEEIEIDEPDIPLADLPQTGQLWWPVPLLAAAGMFLFILGWALRRRSEMYAE